MSSFKNVSDNYTLTCNEGSGTFTVNASLVVTGNTTFNVPSVTTSAFVTVGENNTGGLVDMGLLAQLTGGTDVANGTFAGLRFDTTSQTWQISPRVTSTGYPIAAYADISTSAANVAGGNTNIQFNQNGAFGGSSNLSFDYTNNRLVLQGTQLLGFTANTPSPLANNVALYSNTVSSGGTGLFFTSPSTSGELISKTKAIVYSIIF